MISHEHKFIFVHIQKTGGKSILKSLDIESGADHRFAKEQASDYGPDIWSRYFKFAFVRNPWDRLVSAYHYRLQGGNGSPKDLERAKAYPNNFSKFCHRLEYFMTLPNEKMFVPQYDWISDDNGLVIVDYVGHLETIAADFVTICNKIGVAPSTIAHTNMSKRRKYQDYYNNKTRDIVEAAYAKDVEVFNYEFEGSPGKTGIFDRFIQNIINH